jgi:hypothetical protein
MKAVKKKKIKKLFEAIKHDKIAEKFSDYVRMLVPEKVREQEKAAIYMDQEVVKSVEMVNIKRWFDDLETPEEIYFLTENQSKKMDSLLRELKDSVQNGDGGVVLRCRN